MKNYLKNREKRNRNIHFAVVFSVSFSLLKRIVYKGVRRFLWSRFWSVKFSGDIHVEVGHGSLHKRYQPQHSNVSGKDRGQIQRQKAELNVEISSFIALHQT